MKPTKRPARKASKPAGVPQGANALPPAQTEQDPDLFSGDLTLLQIALVKILRANRTKYALTEEVIISLLPDFGFCVEHEEVWKALCGLSRQNPPLAIIVPKAGWKAAPIPAASAPATAVVDKESLDSVRFNFNQIVRASKEHSELERLSNTELEALAREKQMEAFKARHYLWQRLSLVHQKN